MVDLGAACLIYGAAKARPTIFLRNIVIDYIVAVSGFSQSNSEIKITSVRRRFLLLLEKLQSLPAYR